MSDSQAMKGRGPAVPHLASKPGGWQGEIWDLRGDVDKAFRQLENGGSITEEWLAPPVASMIYFMAVTLFTLAAKHVHSVAVALAAPRNLVLDFVIAAGVPTTETVMVTYLDIDGTTKVVTVPFPAATGAVDAKVAAKSVISVDISALVDPLLVGSSVSVGFGAAIGLAHKARTRTGVGVHVLQELVDAAPAGVPGTFVSETLSPDYGTYVPNAPPNGVHNYLLTYERN